MGGVVVCSWCGDWLLTCRMEASMRLVAMKCLGCCGRGGQRREEKGMSDMYSGRSGSAA
jgi:hypothetical protein